MAIFESVINLFKKYGIIFLVLLFIIPAITPLFHSGFFSFHDDEQIARLYEIHQSIKAFEIPPRWVSHLGFGYGYPLFNFYPPFVYYLGELIYLLGFSFIASTKIVMGLGFFLSGLFMFLWVRKYSGSWGGFVASVLYTYMPYHGVDLYVRGALSEFFVFVWLPAAFWSLDNLNEKKNLQWIIINSFFLALVVLTHNLIALPFAFFIAIYVLLLILQKKDNKKIRLLLFITSGLLALGLTAYFWIPSLFEKKYTLVDAILTKELANYQLHFVYLQQFWNSSWGYGGSVIGTNDGMTFQVGKLQLFLSFFVGIVYLYLLIKKKMTIYKEIYISMFLLFIFSLFMTTSFSKIIWDSFKPLAYLQFPWRFLTYTAVFSSFLGGGAIFMLQKYISKQIIIAISLIIAVTSMLLIVRYFHPVQYLAVTDENYIANNDIEWRVSKMSFEYVPKGVKTTLSDIYTTQLAVQKSDIPKKSFQIIEGNIAVIENTKKPSYKKYTVSGDGGTLVINTYFFPGWKVYGDGKEKQITKFGPLQLISFSVENGEHIIEVRFENTIVRVIANAITIVFAFIVIGLYVYIFLINHGIMSGKVKNYYQRFLHEKTNC